MTNLTEDFRSGDTKKLIGLAALNQLSALLRTLCGSIDEDVCIDERCLTGNELR